MPTQQHNRRWIRASGWARWGVLAAVPLVFVAAPSLGRLPARLIRGCPTWIVLAGTLEVLSILGFVVSFALVFCGPMSRRQSIVAGLRALGASTVLPGGGLIGPAIGARSAMPDPSAPLRLVRSTIAFTILTTAPGAIALAVFGVSLWLGWPGGPHEALLTLPAAAVSVAALALLWWLARPSAPTAPPGVPRRGALRWVADSSRVPRAGAAEARRLLGARDWRLLGPLAYYACDNAVLWAAFHAYGYSAALGAIVMGYLIGSLGGALPVPGGFGAAEGGLVGALVLYGAPVGPAASAVLLYRGISLGLSVSLGGGAWALANGRRRDQ
ncbi:MAG TPA: lysylphosphatidylglycerol synthase transmembrane domain-containing protein [Solirubrobacteraceae bacterium]|nr:lysylphosphatidylglycerol synthase transmembrane domain-containing protein [Solirubrobacteraceae bacterium]